MGRVVLIAIVCGSLAMARETAAHTGPTGASAVNFRQGHDQDILAEMTFGFVLSHDGGATWEWMCERAVGYSGQYVPKIAYTQSGAIFASSFGGLVESRDGCSYGPTPAGATFIGQILLGPDGAIYYAASDSAVPDSAIYKSTDDGVTFTEVANPGIAGDSWQSMIAVPSDPNHIYLSGFRYIKMCPSCDPMKQWLLYVSTDGANTFTPLPGNLLFQHDTSAGLTTAFESSVNFVGVDPVDPNILYAQVTTELGNVIGDGLYKIDTANDAVWTKILAKGDGISFLARRSGQLVAATNVLGTFVSNDRGATWTQLAGAPAIGCLAETSAGVVWACTLADTFSLRTSTDLATWTGVLDYRNIAGPVSCPAGTVQHDMCESEGVNGEWCGLKRTLHFVSDAVDCAIPGPPPPPPPAPAGCCEAGGTGGAGAFALASLIAIALRLFSRRRTAAARAS